MTLTGSRFRNLVIIGDLILFAAFPYLGGASHDSVVGIGGFIRTFVPFAVAWLIVGSMFKTFKVSVIHSFRRTYQTIPVALLVSGVVAIVIRVVVFDRPFILTFALVAIGVTTLLVAAWRLALASIPGR